MARERLQMLRGAKADLPTLAVGEPAFCTDTKEFYIGSESGNVNPVVDASTSITTINTHLGTIDTHLGTIDTHLGTLDTSVAGKADKTYVDGLTTGTLSTSGYTRLPNGLIMQWGVAMLPSTANTIVSTQVNFPTAFTTACYSVSCTPQTTACDVVFASVHTITISSFKCAFKRTDTTTAPVHWVAFGK